MRLACLGSGSKGNGLLVAHDDQQLLIDCGFTLAETETRLARLGVQPAALTAILVTHEHSDHIGGVGALARKYDLPVWMSRGSHLAGRCGTIRALKFLSAEEPVLFGGIRVFPFSVPHDAREPLQFVFETAQVRFALLTDAGCSTPFLLRQLGGCDALMLECNHDEAMLHGGRYPPALKRRVGGAYGHLSNRQAAEILRQSDRSRLRHVIAAHLSEENNRPELARAALAEAVGWSPEQIRVADQYTGFEWLTLA